MGTRGSQGSSLLRALGSDLCYQRHRTLMTDAEMSVCSCGLSQASHLAFAWPSEPFLGCASVLIPYTEEPAWSSCQDRVTDYGVILH